MPLSRAIRQLLKIREMIEDRARVELESAVAELHSREVTLKHNAARAREGRRLVAESVLSTNRNGRITGMNEQLIAAQHEENLKHQLDDAHKRAEILQQTFMAARGERQQVQSLIENVIARDEQDARRDAQHELDDWHRDRSRRRSQ